MTTEIPKTLWIIVDNRGSVWTDGAYAKEELARSHFVRKLLPHCIESLDYGNIWDLWAIAQKNGFKAIELKVQQ